jgi:hypothetical protein
VPPTIDLVQQFDTAEKRSNLPMHEAFNVYDVTVNGETKRGIMAHPTSRIIWKVTVPNRAWLRTSICLDPRVWDQEGDGVLFRVGVSDGRAYEELVNQYLNPYAVHGDRRWVPVSVDLSAYGGREVSVIFNTNSSLPGKGDDSRHDWAVWGAPAIYLQP